MKKIKLRKPTLFIGEVYRGIRLQRASGSYVIGYLGKTYSVIERASKDFNRVIGFCVLLRFPSDFENTNGDECITRFWRSFKAKYSATLERRKRDGRRVHRDNPRYIWCRETSRGEKDHFHVFILLNRDNCYRLGRFDYERGEVNVTLVDIVRDAWASAINCSHSEASYAVNFPENPVLYLNRNSACYEVDFGRVFRRAAYLAKIATKQYGDRKRSFGSSIR